MIFLTNRDGKRRCSCVCSFDILCLLCCYRGEREDVAVHIHPFFFPVYDADGTLLRLVPSSLTNEVKEIFAESSSTSEQARRVQEQFISLADDIGQETTYLSRLNQFPRLSLTNILFMLQSHYHIGNIDYNMESLKKSFSVLTLLAPPGNCDEFDQLQNSSANNELEEIPHQPSERRASFFKTVFIKGRQETLDDVIALLANVTILGKCWVTFDEKDVTAYPYVLVSSPSWRTSSPPRSSEPLREV